MEGEDVSLTGNVGFVDTGVPDGIWFELTEGECQLGAFVDKALLKKVGGENVLQLGKELTISGTLITFDGILEIEVFEISGFGEVDSADSVGTGSQAIKPARLSFSVTNDETTRYQDITLTVTDAQGNPLPGMEIFAEQTDLDFFFDSSYNPNKAFTTIVDGYYDWSQLRPDANERKEEYAAVGFNTHLIHAQALWTDVEPENNQYVPAVGAIATEWVEEGWEYTPDLPNTRFYRANMGPSFANPKSNLRFSGWAPEWIQNASEEDFFAEFEEYLTEIVSRGSKVVGGYHLYDIGVEINNWYATPWQTEPTWFPVDEDQWMKWVDILDWEIRLIKKLDPESFICLNFDHMGWDPEKYPVHLGPQVFTEALMEKILHLSVSDLRSIPERILANTIHQNSGGDF